MLELAQKVELKQTLTPQQILLSTLLQLPSVALEQRIKTELELNPVLELVEDVEELAEMEEEVAAKEDEEEESGPTDDNEDSEAEPTEEEVLEEIDLDEYFQNDGYEAHPEVDHSQEEVEFQNPYRPSLAEKLLEQVDALNLDKVERQIMEELIWSIDEHGYLIIPLEYVAEKFEVPLKKVEKLHQQLMQLDPLGIGARNLQECLQVQVDKLYPGTFAQKIIHDHFDDFANKRYEKIMRNLGVTKKELLQAEALIQRLNPKPGEGYLEPASNYVTPDFFIHEENGEFIVTLNDTFIPELRISRHYLELLKNQKNLDPAARGYLKRKLESAKWFINSIQMRRITMLKVIHAIIERQKDFFLYGPGHLKPMVLRDIAEDIGMDISTVSRVTSGKYAQTDWGIFELRYFFSEGIETKDGENISTRRIKERLKEIIDNEDKSHPISDEGLSKILKKEGFPIARRTVAKYREQLGIPVARLRREL